MYSVRPRIFISYRTRHDSWIAGYIEEYLRVEFGSGIVFRDYSSINYGEYITEKIKRTLDGIDIFILVVGMDLERDLSRRRSSSVVLAEVRAALQRSKTNADQHGEVANSPGKACQIFTILVEHPPINAAALPVDLRELADRKALTVTRTNTRHEIAQLVQLCREHLVGVYGPMVPPLIGCETEHLDRYIREMHEFAEPFEPNRDSRRRISGLWAGHAYNRLLHSPALNGYFAFVLGMRWVDGKFNGRAIGIYPRHIAKELNSSDFQLKFIDFKYDLLRLRYRNTNPLVRQYGNMMFQLNGTSRELSGFALGWGPISNCITSVGMSLYRVENTNNSM